MTNLTKMDLVDRNYLIVGKAAVFYTKRKMERSSRLKVMVEEIMEEDLIGLV